jgi:hypothetical protein
MARAVLTRILCRELVEAQGDLPDRRVSTALSILLSWIAQHFPESREPYPSDGLDQMAVTEERQSLLAEVRDETQVGQAFFMLMTADSSIAANHDKAVTSRAAGDLLGEARCRRSTAALVRRRQMAFARRQIELELIITPHHPRGRRRVRFA